MNQNLMQRYGDHWQNPNNWLFSSPVCCDRQSDLRQNTGKDLKTVVSQHFRSVVTQTFYRKYDNHNSENIIK